MSNENKHYWFGVVVGFIGSLLGQFVGHYFSS